MGVFCRRSLWRQINFDKMNTENLAKVTNSNYLFNWARKWSQSKLLWAFPVGTACCDFSVDNAFNLNNQNFVEPYPFYEDALGCDVLIVSGTISRKLIPYLKDLYNNLEGNKWVIAIGACAINGGPYQSYSTVHGLDKLFKVDVWVPGCPPNSMAIYEGILTLEKKVKASLELS